MEIRVALIAADDIAEPLCQSLGESGMLGCLITQADKPKGRGRKVSPLLIRSTAEKFDVRIFAPETLRNDKFREELGSAGIDIPVVFAYGLIVPKCIRNWQPFPCVNVHPSILPRWRGPNPVRSSIFNGDEETGVTIHFTERRVDAGDVIMESERVSIGKDEIYDELRKKLSIKAVEIVSEFLSKLMSIGKIKDVEVGSHSGKEAIRKYFDVKSQDESKATITSKLEKEDIWINWGKESEKVHNLIRGLSSNPGARTGDWNKPLKVLRSELVENVVLGDVNQAGIIVDIVEQAIICACGSGYIGVTELQPSGKRIMSARDYVNGYRLRTGDSIAEG